MKPFKQKQLSKEGQRRDLTFSRSLFALCLLSCTFARSYAQQSRLEGVVRNATNRQTLERVSIRETATKLNVATDLSGRFSLPVEGNKVRLLLTAIGYVSKDTIVTVGNKPIEFLLKEDNTKLDEVIIVGYGQMKKASVTGAIAQMSGDELKTAPTANLSSMLQGRLPGLVTRQSSGQPGSDGASLMVRGYNTLGNNSPLIIVDGIEREFPQINPDEVEAISVLKDASAAIYGVRGANGVILITTKKGKQQKPTLNYKGSYALSKNTAFPEFLNAADYVKYYNKAQELDGVAETSRRFNVDEIERITHGDPQGIFGNTDWFNMLFKSSAPTVTNNLTLNGGSDRYRYFVSTGAFNQDGIIDRTSYDRYNGRINFDADILDNLKLSLNIAYRDDIRKEPGLSAGLGNSYASVFAQAMMSYPFLPAYNAAGIPVGSLNPGNGNQNPLAARDLSGENSIRSNRFQSNLSLEYEVPGVSGLRLKVNGAFDKGYTMRKAYLLPYQLDVYNNATRQYALAFARHANGGVASLNQWFTDSWQKTIQPSISYANKFGAHSVNALFLYEYMRTDNSSLSGGRRGYPITDIMDLNFGEEVIDNLVKGGHGMFSRAGYSFRLNYDYADKYLLEVLGRYDGSPMLPAHTRWDIFPAVSAGWRISKEPFFKEALDVVDDLKIRGSIGKLGNDRIGDYQFLRTMSLGADPVVLIGNTLGKPLNVTTVPNFDIKWETTTTYNGGLEATLWKGLLGVEADVFYRVTKDILQGQSNLNPPSFGGYFPNYINSGVVDSRGFELVLSHRNTIGDFNYNVRGNVSFARSKVIETTENANVPDYLRRTGRPIGLKYGFVADGFFQSEEEIMSSALFGPTRVGEIKLKDLNGDGRITFDQDWTVIGKSDLPEMMFGLNLGGSYKGFDFSAFFQGAARSDVALSGLYTNSGIYDNTFYTMPFYQDGNSPKYLVENAWTPENTNAKYPRLSTQSAQSGGKFSSFWIKDGAYLRLKTAQIGYTLPASWLNKAKIQQVRCFVSGSNLVTWSSLPYLDPEMPSVNQGYYPQQRVYEFGLSLTF
ncbi:MULTISPECIES: SusC/RagA family TonB-linked outer membrane protein [unclassified Sphingobacterium]|uniref:SusC/RagA family TonB-linked outer membrane protein n=1 Tax=unclassified Sphingobacterium TaxID=2609468 RepID=UPI0025D41E66|nr:MULTISPECIES: TonB-dependent receptor [unclassified Sphingobacterium]